LATTHRGSGLLGCANSKKREHVTRPGVIPEGSTRVSGGARERIWAGAGMQRIGMQQLAQQNGRVAWGREQADLGWGALPQGSGYGEVEQKGKGKGPSKSL
jgi:hypothetical protein